MMYYFGGKKHLRTFMLILFIGICNSFPLRAEQEVSKPLASELEEEMPSPLDSSLEIAAEESLPPLIQGEVYDREENIFEDSPIRAWWERDYLLGDWGGWRSRLLENGFAFRWWYTGDFLGNPVGGAKQGFRRNEQVVFALDFDFEPLTEWSGLKFHMAGRYRGGGDLNNQDVQGSSLIDPTNFYGAQGGRLLTLYFEQNFWDEGLVINVGRQVPSYAFADIPASYVFVNNGLNGGIGGIGANIPFGSADSSWGLLLQSHPVEDWTFQVGVYDYLLDVGAQEDHGLDFSLGHRDGVLVMAEIGYRPHHGPEATGLPGVYQIGGYSLSAEFPEFASERVQGSSWGVYASAEQMVYREGKPGTQQGLWVFLTASGAPPDVNPVPYFLSGGLVYQGLIPGRDNDQLAFGFIYGWFSSEKRKQEALMSGRGMDSQAILELTYSLLLTPWLSIQPDFQYLIDPGADGSVPDALVLGAQVQVTF